MRSKGDPNIAFSIWFNQFGEECWERMEKIGDPHVKFAETMEEYLRCVEDQPMEINCKQGPPQPFEKVMIGIFLNVNVCICNCNRCKIISFS